ncbi:MAG: Fic family protein [Kiritimatiellae bacterium]|nr:Fic family protein [Kiritimatiellia bacterium]
MNEEGIFFNSSEETAKRWGISDRRVRILCEKGQVSGARRNGKLWEIPQSAEKPRDGRTMRSLGIPRILQGRIAEIESLKAQLASKRPLTEGEREQLRNAFLVDYTYSSNAIEGNTLTLSETAMVLSGITIGEKPLKDHLEATGHRDAFLCLEDFVSSGEAVSETFVRQLHSLVLADKPMDKGVYRRIPVIITGAVHTPPQPYMVEPMMESWVRDLRTTRLHPLVAAAEFHIRFEAIHPFIDGNGRTGRLLANFILMRSGYLPISIKYEDRRAYYEAFTAYHADDNLIPMLEIFVEREFARLSEYLNIIK